MSTPLLVLLIILGVAVGIILLWVLFVGGVIASMHAISHFGKVGGPLIALAGLVLIVVGSWWGFVPLIVGLLICLPAYGGW